jgi:tetratricopeptide (TPR) repeat protein
MKRATLALVAIALVALATAGLSLRRAGARAAAPAAPAPGSYEAAEADLAKKRKLAEVMADAAPGSWSRRAQATTAELSYAQLTGDYDAYAAAERSLAEAFRVARSNIDDDAVGPLLLKAQLSFELHRLPDALESLRAPERQAEFFHNQRLLAEITSLRGAVKFQLGDYEEGLATLRRSAELDPSAGHRQRLAIALAKVGGDDEATRIFEETEREAVAPRARAWIALQRAQMDLARGRRAEARRRLELACALFPGFWQTEEHLAELDAEEGHTDRAIASYRALVTRTNDPEFMDALARLLAERDPAEARALLERSNALYDARLSLLPEASYGHALEHFLRMVPDPARAVEVAEKNRALRPNGEARTRLAQAYLRAGRMQEARDEILSVTSSAWVSAESFATAARVLRASRDPETPRMEARARALNPYALEELDWL